MDIVTLVKQIQNNNLDNFYVFAGEEITLANIYLNKMGTVKRVDTVAEILSKLRNKNKLFKNNEHYIYVVRDDSDFMNYPKLEELISQIKCNTLVFCCTELKKNTKFYKATKEHIVEFNCMTTQQLLGEVQKIVPINKKLAEDFIVACDNNYGAILNELDKVKYEGISVIEELVENSKTYSTFTFIDLLFAESRKSMEYLIRLLDSGEANELGILTLIFNKASQLLQINEGIIPEGVNEWAAKKMKSNSALTQKQLYRATRYAKIYSEGIKNGDYNPYDATLLCCMKILK